MSHFWLQNLRFAPAPSRSQRRHKHRRSLRNAMYRPNFELMERRTLFSTFTVLNLADSGPDSLRAAITDANGSPGADAITFARDLNGTITLGSELNIVDDL